uniref:Protein FAM76A n=1 Tax=Romanomermis culicivorax TaxID=13658 RepID=A0A915K4Z9_ROMCU
MATVKTKKDYHSANKCIYCREPCDPIDSTEYCRRCTKNEQKYGKYCQLPAAFLGKICQLCTHYVKRCGNPITCRHCKLKAAFVKPADASSSNDKKKMPLCRLCKLTYTKTLTAVNDREAERLKKRKLDNTDSKSEKAFPKRVLSSEQGSTSSTQISSTSSNRKLLLPTRKANDIDDNSVQQAKEALNEHVFTLTQLKDETLTLKRQIQAKDREIFERDKRIADLKAQAVQTDKEYQIKMTEMQKHHRNTVDILQEKIKNLTKDLAVCSRKNATVKEK